MTTPNVLAHLAGDSTSAVLVESDGSPGLAYWGAPLGDEAIDGRLFERPVVGGGLDVDPPVGLVTDAARGWFGRPGVEGHRAGGGDAAPRFELVSTSHTADRVDAHLADLRAGLELDWSVGLSPAGTLCVDVSIRNVGSDDYHLDALRVSLPLPERATELLTLGGRHLYEFAQRRTTWEQTCVTIENRHGKTSHERFGGVVAGTAGFGEHHGEVWGCHLAWSGNYELVCDAVSDGHRVVQLGELLLPGEVTLAPGEAYAAPSVVGAYAAAGLNEMSGHFHDHLRAREAHPRGHRPVHLNTWEAVYFDHDLERLKALAEAAGGVGVERFVLDDGWFGSRRDDHRSLGDWEVSAEAWPDGLDPLIDHVRDLGMEFGIWVEPEMINPDSDLYRAHPEWVLGDPRYPTVLGRNQLVLDVGRPEVRDHLFDRLDRLLAKHDIAYLKWDHNRDLVSPVAQDLGGRSGVHRQTHGFYELLDRLRTAHPNVEIETCASGGGRVDFGVLDRTARVWTSDSIDALDRLSIQRGFSLFFPPELMGTHIGATTTHTTLRRHRLGFRGASALFGAFGIEWNLLEATPAELDRIKTIVDLHRRLRPLLHSGRVLRVDHPDPTVEVNGVVARDGSEAVVAVSRVANGPTHHTAPLRLPLLADDLHYRVEVLGDLEEPLGGARRQPSWLDGPMTATGRQLREAGLRLPQLHPESTLLLRLEGRR